MARGLDPNPSAIAPADWKKLQSVQDHLERTQTLSAVDIAFAAHLLHSKPPLDTSKTEADRQLLVLDQLTSTRPKKLTPAQRRQLFSVVLPYTDSPGTVVRTAAMLVLASCRDPRAVPILERHIQSDPDSLNRKIAGDFLRHLQVALRSPAPAR